MRQAKPSAGRPSIHIPAHAYALPWHALPPVPAGVPILGSADALGAVPDSGEPAHLIVHDPRAG